MAGEGTKRIIELPEATTVSSGDYFAIDSGENGTRKVMAGNAFKNVDELAAEVATAENTLDDITTVGFNLFDKTAIKRQAYIANNGQEAVGTAFYLSDFIPVEEGAQYVINNGVGSPSTYFTTVFYDADKVYKSGSYNGSTSPYTVTIPSGISYIRVNGALARLDLQAVYKKTGATAVNITSDYQRIIDGKNATGVFLFSSNAMMYDYDAGTLSSLADMRLVAPDNRYNLGKSLSVGKGSLLWWNGATRTMYASDNFEQSKDVYLIGILANTKFEGLKQFAAIDSAFPIFTLDLINNKLYVDVQAQQAFVIYNGNYYGLPVGTHQELDLPIHGFVLFNYVTKQFEVASQYTYYSLNKGIPVLIRYYRNVYSLADYEVSYKGTAFKDMISYGDSLTWYNGHEFTWGPHEGEVCIGFETYALNYLNLRSATNRGASGETTPQICSRIRNATDYAEFDILTIMGGDNDDRLQVNVGTLQPVGGTFDTSTVYGALQSAIEHVYNNVSKTIRIILVTEPMGWTYRNGTMKRVSELYPNAYRNVAKQYGLPLIDLWNESGINELNRTTYYADPAPEDNNLYMYHPNNEGWKRLSQLICDGIKKYI